VKIKPRPRQKAKGNPKAYHYWLVEEKPKSAGRLAQLGTKNKRIAASNRQLRIAEGSAEREDRTD